MSTELTSDSLDKLVYFRMLTSVSNADFRIRPYDHSDVIIWSFKWNRGRYGIAAEDMLLLYTL